MTKLLELTGVSDKGVARIVEHGRLWEVIKETNTVYFTDAPGPWMFIQPMENPYPQMGSRWVHGTHDKDFIIKEVAD